MDAPPGLTPTSAEVAAYAESQAPDAEWQGPVRAVGDAGATGDVAVPAKPKLTIEVFGDREPPIRKEEGGEDEPPPGSGNRGANF